MKFRTQYSNPIPYKFASDQDVEVEGFQPNAVESVGQMISRLKAGGTVQMFQDIGDLGLGQFVDEFDLQDALESGTDRSAAAESPSSSGSGDRNSEKPKENGAAGENPPPATGE